MSFVVRKFDVGNLETWNIFLLKSPFASFHQSSLWADFQNSINWKNTVLALFDGEVLIGGANVYQFSFPNKTNFLYIPGGPVLSFDNEDLFFEQWRALMPEILALIHSNGEVTTHLRIEPLVDSLPEWFLSNFDKASFNLLPSSTQMINLDQELEEILAGMKQKGRYNLKQVQKGGVVIEMLDDVSGADIKDFYSLYEDTFKRNDFYGKQIDFFKHFFVNCKDISKLFFARIDDKRVAAAVLVYFGGTATYLYGASSDFGRKFNASYLLQWEMMKYAKEKGFHEYDLWGIAPSLADKDHAWYGMTRFKKQLGGYQVDRIGAYDYVFNKEAYKAFVEKYES